MTDADARHSAAEIANRASAWRNGAVGLLTGGATMTQLAQHATLDHQRDELTDAIDRLVADTLRQAHKDAGREAAAMDVGIRHFIEGAAVAAAAVFAGLAWTFHAVGTGIRAAHTRAARIAAGDLAPIKATRRRDEFGGLLQALERMCGQLRQATEAERQAQLDVWQRHEVAERRMGILDQLTGVL